MVDGAFIRNCSIDAGFSISSAIGGEILILPRNSHRELETFNLAAEEG
jgi:hypothetical protein